MKSVTEMLIISLLASLIISVILSMAGVVVRIALVLLAILLIKHYYPNKYNAGLRTVKNFLTKLIN